MTRLIPAVLATLALSAMPHALSAQSAPELDGSGWVNGEDLSLERLRGKVVVLYFYEEG